MPSHSLSRQSFLSLLHVFVAAVVVCRKLFLMLQLGFSHDKVSSIMTDCSLAP